MQFTSSQCKIDSAHSMHGAESLVDAGSSSTEVTSEAGLMVVEVP